MPAHEVCAFSLSEIIKISVMDEKEFHLMFTGRSANAALKFRRELQKAMRDYANKIHSMDIVKEELLAKCQMIERWCRVRYYKERLPYYLSGGMQMISAKACVRRDWESFVAANGY